MGEMGFNVLSWIRDVFCTQRLRVLRYKTHLKSRFWLHFEQGTRCYNVWCTGPGRGVNHAPGRANFFFVLFDVQVEVVFGAIASGLCIGERGLVSTHHMYLATCTGSAKQTKPWERLPTLSALDCNWQARGLYPPLRSRLGSTP